MELRSAHYNFRAPIPLMSRCKIAISQVLSQTDEHRVLGGRTENCLKKKGKQLFLEKKQGFAKEGRNTQDINGM